MPEPTFSFLTTAFRTEAYLPDTIESVRAQSRGDWELIVVDNGLSDETAAIVRRFAADPRIRLVRQPNRGYAGGVGAAAAVATGRLFCVLDSDDMLLPQFCETVGAVFDADPAVDAVGCDAVLFDDRDGGDLYGHLRSVGVRERPDPQRRLDLRLMLGGCIPYYTGAVRRNAWSVVGGYGNAGADAEEDVVMWLALAEGGFDVRLLPDRLARCRVRETSASRDPLKIDAFERRLMASFEKVEIGGRDECELRAALDSTLRRFRYRRALRRAREALLAGDSRAARSEAVAALTEQRTVRAALVACGTFVAPEMLRAIHPAKQRISAAVRATLS